jgi:predicted transposase YdaD
VTEPGETTAYETFRYHVVRLWLEPLAPLLSASIGLLPLAPLTDEAAANLEPVVRRVNERLKNEAPPDLGGKLMTATFVLMGLRYDAELTAQLYREVTQMEESSTYQLILSRGEAKGRVQEARETLLDVGRLKFGEPDATQHTTIQGITDHQRLRALTVRVSSVSAWQELLATV